MSNATTPITRALNKTFKGRAPRIQVSFAGSFVAVRIEDPGAEVSVKVANEIATTASELLVGAGLITNPRWMNLGYHMDGVVINWNRD